MKNQITDTFTDTVRALGIKSGADKYDVIFNRHAAFYKIDSKKSKEIDSLKKSKEESNPVEVECDAITRDIIRVSA